MATADGKMLAVNVRRRGLSDVIIGEPHLRAPYAPAGAPDLAASAATVVRGGSTASMRESDEHLYVRLAPELVRFATTLVGPSDAEDLLSSGFTKAITSPGWDRVEHRRAYLYRMLVNEARKSHRSTSRRRQREIRVVHRDTIEMERGLDPDVVAALKRLTVRQRAVVHLTYWADLTPRQVAETLDTSLRTVERELTTARHRLEQMLS